MTSCKDAIKNWETKTGEVAAEATAVKLYAQNPPISKMDAALNSLDKCEHLSLSTNSIDRLIPLTGKVLVLSWTHRMMGRSVQHPILFKSSLLTGLHTHRFNGWTHRMLDRFYRWPHRFKYQFSNCFLFFPPSCARIEKFKNLVHQSKRH